jgi:hypothetical protein
MGCDLSHPFYKEKSAKMKFILFIFTLLCSSFFSFSNDLNKIRAQQASFSDKQQYQRYLTINANVFALSQKAKEAGVKITGSEIQIRTKILNEIFSDVILDTNKIIEELLVEKYLTEVHYLRPENNEAADQFVAMFINDKISKECYEPFIKTANILRSNAAKNISRNEIEQLRIRSSFASRPQNWSPELARIQRSPIDCIVQSGKGECILTVIEFNALVPFLTFPKSFSIDSARLFALDKILNRFFHADEAKLSGFTETISKEQLQRRKVQYLKMLDFSKLGPRINDEKELMDTYYRYYDSIFCKKEELFFRICGSTDSLAMKTVLKRINDGDTSIVHNFSPIHQRNLPRDLLAAGIHLDLKTYSSLVRTSHGYYILMLDSICLHPEISFEQASDTIALLASRDKWSNFDEENEKRAYEFYISDRKRFLSPDTIFFRGCMTIGKADKNLTKKEMESFVSTKVPDELRTKIEKLATEKDFLSTKMHGPITTQCGVWHVYIDSIYKGGKQLSYSSVKDEIVKSFSLPPDSETIKTQDQFITKLSISTLYMEEAQAQSMKDTLSDKEIIRMIQSGKFENGELGLDSSIDLSQYDIDKEIPERKTQLILIARIANSNRPLVLRMKKFEDWKKELVVSNISNES